MLNNIIKKREWSIKSGRYGSGLQYFFMMGSTAFKLPLHRAGSFRKESIHRMVVWVQLAPRASSLRALLHENYNRSDNLHHGRAANKYNTIQEYPEFRIYFWCVEFNCSRYLWVVQSNFAQHMEGLDNSLRFCVSPDESKCYCDGTRVDGLLSY